MCVGCGQGDINHRFAIRIRFGATKRLQHGAEHHIMAAKDKTRPVRQTRGGIQNHLAFNRQISPRRAKQISGIHAYLWHISQPQRAVAKVQRKINPFGQEIFDQKRRRCQRVCIKIGVNLHRPHPARGRPGHGHFKDIATGTAVLDDKPRVFHPVGAI